MSTKDAVTSAPQDKISKRSTNHVRQDPRQLVKPRDHHDRQAPPPATTLESRDGATFNASSNHSRQTWTHSAFSKYIPGSDIADKGHSQQQAHSHTHTSGLSLAGVCTVLIDPYTFVDTKFYTLDTKSDPVHQVVMEFKDNPGALWLFPDEASLEFTPVNDHKSTQISASFSLPHLATTTDRSHLATLVIQHGTTALREGLELAVKGSKTTITPSSHKPTDPPTSRSHTPSTYSDDPSEILGSGRQSVSNNNSSNNGNTNHSNTNNSLRKQDPMSENQKSLKSKRPKDQDEKSAAVSSKKKVVAPTTPKKNGLPATPASTAQQKRCGYCNCITTPMWRRGPNGPGTLCNACGVKWKHGKILQDVQETVQAPKSIPVSSSPPSSGPSTTTTTATTTTNARAAGPKSAKQSPQNGTSRHVDEIKSESNNTTTTTTKKRPLSSHGAPRKDVETRSGEKSSSRENKRSRVVEPDKLVPVKKRHSSKGNKHYQQLAHSF
ncbi:hypothetical protein BGX31_003407 [Mortierella sp. GBA43]|nr:hypothetical protein BGX31_003407 [Mortierella sp. GBA43]